MKKIIQNAFNRFILVCTLTLIGLTSYAQFNYVPGTTYTFRTLVSSTQSVQIDVLYDANYNATVTLTSVAAQPGDKRASHIFLPTNNEYTFNENTASIEVSKNNVYYKAINIFTGANSDFTTGPKKVPQCDGCEIGGGNCELLKTQTNNCWQICCDDDSESPVCFKCREMKWVEEKGGSISTSPLLIIRVSGNLTIQ
ncbi:MAG: hypothetical protein CFE21_11825 [Bacteroidetes bacterium B1(2017)]|nr:MAG: hypothetical protein CFE21_11825 [Bacteroidetes bacterium B1(2017)]